MKTVSATDTLIPVPIDGANGADAVRYWLVASVTSITKGRDGTVTPSKVSCRVMEQTGDNEAIETTKLFVMQTAESATPGMSYLSRRYTPGRDVAVPTEARSIGFVLYRSGSQAGGIWAGSGSPIDTLTIPVVEDGANGKDGEDGSDGADGTDGKDGADGEDAVRYWLLGSDTQVVRSALGQCAPAAVSCKAMKQVGNGAAEVCSDVTIRYCERRGNSLTAIKSYTAGTAVTVGTVVTAVNFYLYKNDALADALTIPVINDGKPGERGANGRLPIPYGEYDPNVSYTATDIVAPYVLQDGEYYVMNKSVTVKGVSPKTDYASNGSNATWLHMERFKAIFAELLMARLGLIGKAVFYDEFMFSQYGQKNGEDVNYAGGYDVPTDAGGTFDPNIVINFLTGALRCKKADITGTINATDGRIGGLAIKGNSLVGLVDGEVVVSLGMGEVTNVTSAFSTKAIEFTMSSRDQDTTTDVKQTQFGYWSGEARRPGELSENRDDGNYTDDTTLSCKVSFKLDSIATKVEFGRFDVWYDTRSGSFSGEGKGSARLYRVNGSTRTKIAEWELGEQSTYDYEVSSLAAGNYEVDILAWLERRAGSTPDWWGDVIFGAGAIWVTQGAITNGRVEIAKDGFLCYQGETRYLFFSKNQGLEVKYGNYGLKVGGSGLQKLVGGTWKDINS